MTSRISTRSAPECGTIEDFALLVQAAHARGIRVICDLVINHTSDQHPWFVESRSSRDNPKADWVRCGPTMTSRSRTSASSSSTASVRNWSFDPVRQQFYWHRFYHHQPDLNYDNPRFGTRS